VRSNTCKIESRSEIVLGPSLLAGSGAVLTADHELTNAVYLPGADGTRVIYGKKGRIYY
jgi:hypothetical protein